MNEAACDNPETSNREPWWFYLWIIWGLICAVIVFCMDGSLPASLIWLTVGFLIGRYGMALWERLSWAAMLISSVFFDGPVIHRSAFGLDWQATTVNILNPNRKPWETYLPVVISAGVPHGILLGTVLGALLPLDANWTRSSFVGASLGLGVGPLVVCVLYAVVFPAVLVVNCRGPSVDGIRELLSLAVEIARRDKHQFIAPAHLLLAMVQKPSGAVEKLLVGHPVNYSQIHDYIVKEFPVDSPNTFVDDFLTYTIENAIVEAKKLRHDHVEAGHLLLHIVDEWPTETTETLEMIGITPVDIRQQIVSHLNRL